MRILFSTAAAIVLALSAASVRGDGLFYQLPEDGAWVQYRVEGAVTMGEEELLLKGSLRMASVGRVVENGEPCRWIEADFRIEAYAEGDPAPMESSKLVAKLLIPEKYLKKGINPMDHAVRGWMAGGRFRGILKNPKEFDRTPFPVMLSGPLEDLKELEAVVVETKLGKLSCPGVIGCLEFEEGPNRTVQIKMETRLHPKAPFGVVASRWVTVPETKEEAAVKKTVNFTLSDFGDGAKSEMPKKQ